MHVACDATGGVPPPPFFCKTNSVLAGNYAAPAQHLREKIVQRALDSFANGRVPIVSIRHDVDVNVTVTGMTKARDRESMLCLQRFREFHQIDQTAARDDYILIQCCQTGSAQ